MEKEIMTNTIINFIFGDVYIYVVFSVIALAMGTLLYLYEKQEQKSKKK
jgi:hypothetical protein